MSRSLNSWVLSACTVMGVGVGGVPAQSQGRAPTAFVDEITVTATGEETTIDEVPAAVTVITREEMDDAQTPVLAELLRRVPGVTVMQQGDRNKLTSVFVRGAESDQTLVMLDGVRLNSPYFGGFDWSVLPTSGLERVEVARGPYSALYGAEALGGVVNLIPGTAARGSHGTVFGEGGSDEWRRYEAALGFGGEAVDLFVSGLRYTGEAELDNSDFLSDQILVDAGISFAQGSRLSLVVQGLEAETGIPFTFDGTRRVDSPERRQTTRQQLIALPLTWQVSDTWQIELLAAQVERRFEFADPDDGWSPFSDTRADTRQARVLNRHRLGQHSVSWGGEFFSDVVDSIDAAGIVLDDRESEMMSGFVQDVWKAGEHVVVIAGARWDDADQWGSELSPRLNLGWQLHPELELRVGYGEGFRKPSVGELYSPFGSNPELAPETSTSYEIGLVQRVKNTEWQLNVFATDLEELIEYDYTAWRLENVGTAEIRGVELVYDQQLDTTGAMSVQVTYLETQGEDGAPLVRRPQWSGSWSLRGLLWGNLWGDLTVTYVGSRDDIDPQSGYAISEADSYTTTSVAAVWRHSEGAELSLRVTNATDEEYLEVLGYPAPGRRYHAGLRWRF